jgi:transposase
VELYARVRRAVHVEGRSQREVAREFGLARKTVRKMLAYPAPPGYQRQKPVRRPKLGPWQAAMDAILEEDKSRPRRQRHTAKRIFERLREEHGYTGGYTIVKDYVRQWKIGAREMFVPLSHAPGEAQADFGEAGPQPR